MFWSLIESIKLKKRVKTQSFPGEPYLWIEVKSLQSVDDQGELCQPVIHDRVEAVQEGGSLDNGLVVGIVETLEPREQGKCTPLQRECRNKLQRKEKEKHSSQAGVCESGSADGAEQNSSVCTLQGRRKERNPPAYDYTVTSGVPSHREIKSAVPF